MRQIKRIIIHCSATKPDMDIGADEIGQWHKKRGFNGIGYHDVIRRDGANESGRDIARSGAHCKGHNHDSIGICMVGGVDENGKPEGNFTLRQWRTLDSLVAGYQAKYPGITVHGHNEFSNKACPSFNARYLCG